MSKIDRWPGWLLLALGLAPGLVLGLLALRSPIATGALVLLLAPAVWLAGRRLRLVWDDAALPAGLRAGAPPMPPYPLQDPLIELIKTQRRKDAESEERKSDGSK